MANNQNVKPKLRRSIYIGLGGTGTDAIKIVKDYFMATSSRVPTMVKFLAIDTNQPELSKKGFRPDEQLPFVLNQPYAIYLGNSDNYSWIPEKNIGNIQGIGNTGAGQVRSNGSFVLSVKELSGSGDCFSSTLKQLRDKLLKVTAVDPDYDLLATTTIDIHLCFSLCGGTGSGMFLEIAKLIKSLVPNSNLIGYAVSNSFYDNVGVHWNVKYNAYASLVELDYCMHAHEREYQNSIYEKVTTKPFDALMYIDNQTYTRNGTEEEYVYAREEVLANIAYAMVLSAGSLGDDTNSIIDNLKGAILSKGYDQECRNGMKSAWVSSLGVSEIFCKKNSGLDLFAHNLSIQELGKFKDGNTVGAADVAKAWIDEFNINEGGPDDPDDRDGLINRMINPDDYQQITTANSIKVDDNGNVDDGFFRANAPVKFHLLESRQSTFAESVNVSLDKHVKAILFPSQGKTTCGLSYLQTVLNTFKESIERYKARMDVEISERKSLLNDLQDDEKKFILQLQQEAKSWHPNQKNMVIIKNSIRSNRLKAYKLECAIKRRMMAIEVYASIINKIVTDYQEEIPRLQNVLDSTINILNSEIGELTIPEKIDEKSTSIDVSFEIANLPDSKIGNACITDWNDFYIETQHTSIKNLADKKDWKDFILKYVRKNYSQKASEPIVQILQSFASKGTLEKFVKDVLNRARPLMDITSFGNTKLHPTEFIIVSLPNSADERTKFIRDAFDSVPHGENAIQYVPIKDSNRIVVYRQLGVIPPYYIKGISSGKNGVYDPYSCEDAFVKLRSSSYNYSPFSRVSYETAVLKGGHSLDTYLGAISESDCFEMWVSGFILDMFSRSTDGNYRFESSEGTLDMDDPEFRTFIILGCSRSEAYKKFEGLSDIIKKEFSKKQTEILSDPEIRLKYDSFFDRSNTSLVNYKRNHSLIRDDEFSEEKSQLEKEFNYLRSKNN